MEFTTKSLREKAALVSLAVACALGGTACGNSKPKSMSLDQAQAEINNILGGAAEAEMRAAMRSPARPAIEGNIGIDLRNLTDPDGISTVNAGDAVLQIKAPVNKHNHFMVSRVDDIDLLVPPVERGLCQGIEIVRINETWIGNTGPTTLEMDEDNPITKNPMSADTYIPAEASPQVIKKKIQTAKTIAKTFRREMANILAHPNRPGTDNNCENPH